MTESDEYDQARAIRKIAVTLVDVLAILGEDDTDDELAAAMEVQEMARAVEFGAVRVEGRTVDISPLFHAALLVGEVMYLATTELPEASRPEVIAHARSKVHDE